MSDGDLSRAMKMTDAPDVFELRLDALARVLVRVETAAAELRAPVIITVRDPREGGVGHLSLGERRELLVRFLPRAKFIDVELRSARAMSSVLDAAREGNVATILSFHDFRSMPSLGTLRRKLQRALALRADILKIAVRTDNAQQLAQLLAFFDEAKRSLPVSAMGIGRLGRRSRIELARRGSVLNYGCITRPQIAGQLSISELQRLRDAYI